MRKRSFLLLIIAMAVLIALTGCGKSKPPVAVDNDTPQQWTLDFATFWPAVDFQVAEGHQAWAQEISDRVAAETPHTINFEWHPQGSLLGATEIYNGVAAGSAHIGTTCPNYTMGMFPLTMGVELPGYANDNALVASVTMHEAWKLSPELQKEYEDVEVMFFWATGPGDFITNTPVKTMEDLAGQQIRAAGGSARAIQALGGTPVAMPMSDSYLQLESGLVNGILGPTDILKGFRLAEVTKYITKTPFVGYNVIFVKVMNKDTWNSFPESVQQIFREVNEKYVLEYGKLRTDHTVIGQQFAIEEFGHEVFELDAAEKDRWIEKIAEITETWVSDTEAAGLPGQAMFELYRDLAEQYSEEYGDYGR